MNTNASCPGPCRERRCGRGFAAVALVLSVFTAAGLSCLMYAFAVMPEPERYDDARLAAAVAALSDDIHAAHRRIDDAGRSLGADLAREHDARANEVAGEVKARVDDVERVRHDLKSEAAHRMRADAATTADLIAMAARIKDLERRLLRAEAGRCRCEPAPRIPPLPGKGLPAAVAPR